MRIVIMGTGPFAVPSAQRLLDEGHDIPLVITRPVARATSKKAPPRPVFDWAIAHGLPLFEPPSINDAAAIDHLRAAQPELLFVCDYGQILSSACLGVAGLGGINLHGSILPMHRGAAPVQWTILRGDPLAGVTVIHMTPGLDAGPTLAVLETGVQADETAEALEPRLAVIGADASAEAITKLAAWRPGDALGAPQDSSRATKAPRFAKADGQLDFRLPADYLTRLVRACQPWPSTFAEIRWPTGKQLRLIIRNARSTLHLPDSLQDRQPGSIVAVDATQIPDAQISEAKTWQAPWHRLLAVATGQGCLLLPRVQPAGKREMDVEAFLRGHPIDGSPQFVLPPELTRQLCE